MDRLYEDFSDGEVDHSFFDSDFEEEAKKQGATTEADGKEHGGCSEVAGAVMDNPDLTLEAKVVEDNVVENNFTEEKRLEEKETKSEIEHILGTDTHSVAPLLVSQNSENPSTSGGISIQRMHEKAAEVPLVVKESEENYYTDEEDSSDDSRKVKVRLKTSKQSGSTKLNKNIAVRSSRSSSSSSSSSSSTSVTDCSDMDSDECLSDSSCSSAKEKSICSLVHPSIQKISPGKNPVEVKPKLGDCADESEDTVTDVTPLSTPDISPIQSFEVAASNENKLKVKRQENVSQDVDEPDVDHRCHQKVLHEAMDLNHLLKAFLQLEKKDQEKMVLDHSCMPSKKNYSFTNEEVRQIDRENQRLLKELTKYSTKPRSKSASLRKPQGPTPKLYHSAINRQREQQRIDRENLAFLKRLEAVKPTVGMKRSEQLMDYQRQMSYLNSATSPRRGKSALSHHSPSRASRTSSHSASSTVSRRSERPVFDSSSGTLQRLNTSNIRGAWL